MRLIDSYELLSRLQAEKGTTVPTYVYVQIMSCKGYDSDNRKRGHCVDRRPLGVYCSECDSGLFASKQKYCHICGAKLREDDNK